MLSNAYFLAKFRFDTAENELAKRFAKFCKICTRGRCPLGDAFPARHRRHPGGRGRGRAELAGELVAAGREPGPEFGKCSAKCRSFSAVSAPIFASKYAFFSIFQNLQDYLTEFFEICLIWQNFADFATFAKMLLHFHENCSEKISRKLLGRLRGEAYPQSPTAGAFLLKKKKRK